MTPDDLLAHTRALLIDFDGPVCSVFSRIPAFTVADQVRDVLADCGNASLPERVATSVDPFDVLRYAATLGEGECRYIEAAFAAHEVEAISSAVPTTGAHELIQAWHQSGRPLAIVSNNSIKAISAYLDLHDLHKQINFISARTSANVSLLKPSPYLLRQALMTLGVPPAESTFIGDSTTDIKAAQASGVRSIGYANKSGKAGGLAVAGADAVTERLTDLTVIG